MAKTKKKNNIEGMKGEELTKELARIREELRTINFKAEGSRSKNVKESANLKKQAARILTALNKSKKQ